MAEDERKGREFLDAALSRGLISKAQYEECLKIAAQLREMGLPEPLPDIAVKKGFLSESDRDAIARRLEHDEEVFPFEIREEIGRGACGVVYRAIQKSLDRPVALKILKPEFARDPKFVEQFLREAKASAKFNHVNIIQGIDAGRYKDSYYFAMELVDGPTLSEILRNRKRLSPEEAVSITLQVARALEFAHKLGLVHRDIKPDNILVAKDGTAKLCDLGMARLSVSEDTIKAGVAVGTPYYMSPEQARGQSDVDIRSDLYSLGATLYHMLSGEPPFKGKPVDEVLRLQLTGHVPDPREKNPSIPPDLVRVVAKLMAKDRRHRYHDPVELQRDLELVSAGKPPHYASRFDAESTVELRLDAAAVAKRYLPYAAAGTGVLLVAAAAVVIGFLVLPEPQGKPPARPPTASAPGKPGKPPAHRVRAPQDAQQADSGEPDDLKKKYDAVLARIKAHPDDFDGNVDLLRKFMEEAGESPYRVLAQERLSKLAEEAAAAEKARIEKKKKTVLALLDKGDVEKAREKVHELFDEETSAEALEVKEDLFEAVGEAEVALWRPFKKRIDAAVEDHDFQAAREAASEALASRFRFIRDRAQLALKRVAEAEAAWSRRLEEEARKARERRKREVEEAFKRFRSEYAPLFLARDKEGMINLADKYEAGYPELKKRLEPFREEYPSWVDEVLDLAVKGLAARSGTVSMTWRGQKLKGTPSGLHGKTVFIRSAGGPEFPVKAEDLSVTDILTFSGLLMPDSTGNRIRAAAAALVFGDGKRFERYMEGLTGPEADFLREVFEITTRESRRKEAEALLAKAEKAFGAGSFDAAERLFRRFLAEFKDTAFAADRLPGVFEKILRCIARGEDPFDGIFDADVSALSEGEFRLVERFKGGAHDPASHWSPSRAMETERTERGWRLEAEKYSRAVFRGLDFVRSVKISGRFEPADDDHPGWIGVGLGEKRFRLWGSGGGAVWTVKAGGRWDNDTRKNFETPGWKRLSRVDVSVSIDKGRMSLTDGTGKVLFETAYDGPETPLVIELAQGRLLLETVEVEGGLDVGSLHVLIIRNHWPEAKGMQAGLQAAFFLDRSFKKLRGQRAAKSLDFTYDGSPLPRMPEDGFSIRYAGFLVVPDDGEYVFHSRGSGTFRLVVGGKQAVFRKPSEGDVSGKPVKLKRGVTPVLAEYVDTAGEAVNRVEWETPDGGRRPLPRQALLHK